MTHRSVWAGAARCALAFLFVAGFVPSAHAAFTVSINGNIVVTDNGVGDTDARTGFVHYSSTIDGYSIELSSSTDNSNPTADLTTSQLRIVHTSSSTISPLNVTLSDNFNAPPGYTGQQNMLNTLTRNLIAGLQTSGVVSSTTAGASNSGGGSGSTAPTVLTGDVNSGMSFGSFNRTSDFYLLTQSINIDGLAIGNGVTITASSFSSSPGNLQAVPAPPALGLLAGGLFTLGLYRRLRTNRLPPTA